MRSLLADIASGGQSQTSRDPFRALRDDVLENLRGLLATPRGKCVIARDFGVEDATLIFHAYPGSVEGTRAALERAIGTYEPRLSNVSVRFLPTDDVRLLLRFEIQATLHGDDGRVLAVKFTSALHADRHLEIR